MEKNRIIRLPKQRKRQRPRILVCTPEITELPEGMGNAANMVSAKGGGLGDISAGLIRALHENDRFELHVAMPKYARSILGKGVEAHELDRLTQSLRRRGLHLVSDSAFESSTEVYGETKTHSRVQRSIAFQRYIINHLLDEIRPEIVHCNDWMTGLIPAAAKAKGIRSVFTLHNVFSEYATPEELDAHGINVRRYLKELYFEHFPDEPEERTWTDNRVDFAATGVLASTYVNTVSPTFLKEMVSGKCDAFAPASILHAVRVKAEQGAALGILNAPSDSIIPEQSRFARPFSDVDLVEGKRDNKLRFQQALGLPTEQHVPLFLWPNRLYSQKGTDLLLELLKMPVAQKAQFALVANGDAETESRLSVLQKRFPKSIRHIRFSEDMSELGKAGADFLLMPSRYEPCGLPQMEAPRFGTLPVVRRTGGLQDTVTELTSDLSGGNGFVFDDYTTAALHDAVLRALRFFQRPAAERESSLKRVMRESRAAHSIAVTAGRYVELYDELIADASAL